MINKKRQELLINNLKSISAEVRQRSLEQLLQIPTFSVEEKAGYASQLLADSEPEVADFARQALQSLRGGGKAPVTAPQPPESHSQPVFAEPPAQETIADPVFTLPSYEPEAPQALEMPVRPPVAQPSSPMMPDLGSLEIPPAPQNMSQPPQAAPAAVQTQPEINDVIDLSLPDLRKINDIPTLLQHIRMLSDKKPSGYLVQLLQLAESPLEEVALSSLQILLNLKDRRVPPQILFKLANENFSSQRRFLMLKIIMETEMELDTSLLERILLGEKDVIVKSGLVKVFARNSRERGLATIITCLQDPDPRVRANTVEVIEEQGIKGCEQNIVELLQDPENRVKVNAAKFLVKNGYQQAFLTLRSMLISSEVWLRDSVIFALGEIGDQASLTLLKAALKDPNQGIRLSVLKSLAKINNSTARQVLRAASGDPDPIVSQVANSLWEKVKDTPLREDIKLPTSMSGAPAPIPQAASAQPAPASAAPQVKVAPAAPTRPVPPIAPTAPILPAVPVQPAAPVAPAPHVEHMVAPVPPARPVPPVASSMPAVSPVPPVSAHVMPSRPAPIQSPAAPARPVAPPPSSAPVHLPPGSPVFAKPRSAEIYGRMVSNNPEDWQIAARDIAFVLGEDQNILLNFAYQHQDEHIRLAAAKILSRRRTPEARAVLEQMARDPNELVSSLVKKTLLINK